MKPTTVQIIEAVRLLKTPRKAAKWITSCEDTDEAGQRCFAIAKAMEARQRPIQTAVFIMKTWIGRTGDPEMNLIFRLLKEAQAQADGMAELLGKRHVRSYRG